MVFIQESKINKFNSRFERWLWGNKAIFCDVVNDVRSVGGLLSYWKQNFFSLEKRCISQRYILLVGTINNGVFKYGLGNINTLNDDYERELLWLELYGLILEPRVSCCIGGRG
ncbi:hypothetical protein PTKIN_Ptkin09bG0138900 [Pterospermum kingtungense]